MIRLTLESLRKVDSVLNYDSYGQFTSNCDELTVMVNFLKLDVFGGISSREEGVGEWIAGIRAA